MAKGWRSTEWKAQAKRERFPFREPWEKILDMQHDGYNWERALKYTKQAFPGMTKEDVSRCEQAWEDEL